MGKLAKRVAIARSGVYKYSAEVIPSLGLSVPPEKKGLGSFGVYRPATVLAKAKDKFVRLPVTLEHPNTMVNGNNFRELAQGFTGDTAYVVYLKDINEVTINSTITLMDNESVNAYYRGIVEVSPGYNGVFDWEDGVSPNGEKYDIVMKDITDVNHLALTRKGRGGKSACILDSLGDHMKKRSSGLFYAVYKMMGGVKDSGEGSFTEKLSSLISDRLKLSEEEITKRVDGLRTVVDYLPDSDDKALLRRYVDDLERINEENDEASAEIGLVIGNLFYTLDSEAMKDAPKETPPVADAEEPDDSTSDEPKDEPKEQEEKETPEEESAEHSEEPAEASEGAVAEDKTVPDEGLSQEDVSIGLDDSIFDKPEADLTPEECAYIHQKLMEMLKEHLKSKIVPPTVPVGEVEEDPQADEGEKGEDSSEGDKPAEESKEREDDMADGDKKSTIDDSFEPQYPTDVLTNDSVSDAQDGGIDIDKFFETKKGAR